MEYVLDIIGLPTAGLKRAFAPLGAFGRHLSDHFIPHARNDYRPHVLGQRALALYSGLLVSVKIFILALVAFGPVAPAFSSAITVSNIIALTNQSRQQYNLTTLTENSELDQAAQNKANDMLAKGYFAHTTPDGKTPWDFIIAAGYNYLMAGENLAVNFTEAESVETAWMNSPEHKANILNPNFENIGIGVSQGQYQGHMAIFVVQEFGVPAAQQVALTNVPTPVQTSAAPAPASPAPAPAKAAAQAPGSAANQGEVLGNSPQSGLPAAPAALTVDSGSIKLDGDNADITAQVSGPAVKVIAYFGQQAVMLLPQGQTAWGGQAPLASLAQSDAAVKLKAFDINGRSAELRLAEFSSGTQANYNLLASAPPGYVTILGHSFNPKDLENRFYLFFIAAILASLVLAIGIKKHIQHLSLIANSSFVVVLACLLFMGG